MVNLAAREHACSPTYRASAIGVSFPPSLHCFTPLDHKEELSTVTLLNYVCPDALVGLCEM